MGGSSGTIEMVHEPITPDIGSVVHGLGLRSELSEGLATDFRRLLHDRGVVILPSQDIGPAGHRAFAASLGAINPPHALLPSLADRGVPEISVISTDNGLAQQADRWHADVTWMTQPSRYSVLHMQESPPVGGDTLWLSQMAAWEALSSATKDYLLTLTARHELVGHHGDEARDAIHPVVCRHPETGRLALFVNPRWTTRIVELSEQESRGVLDMLFDWQQRPEWTARWKWARGDVAVWDNHFVLHYASGGYQGRRCIHRVEVETARPLAPV